MIEKCVIKDCSHNLAAEFKPAYGTNPQNARVVYVTPEGKEIVQRALPSVWARIHGSELGGKIHDLRHSGYDRMRNTNFIICQRDETTETGKEKMVVAVHRINRQAADIGSDLIDLKDVKDITVLLDSVTGEFHITVYPARTRVNALVLMLRWLEALPVVKQGESYSQGSNTFRVLNVVGNMITISAISSAATHPTTLSSAMAERAQEADFVTNG